MKELTLRKWHRYVGVSIMPLIVLQIMSGFLLSVVDSLGFIQRTPQASPEGIATLVIRKLPKFFTPSDDLMVALHFAGGQLFGGILRTLSAISLLWVMFSGTSIYLKIRARTKQKK